MRLQVRASLEAAGIGSADAEARWIVDHVTARLPAGGGGEVSAEAASRADEIARARASGAPLQYLLGVVGFRRLELSVGPGVLIPRPETEIVAERAMSRLPPGGLLVDVGTGSGAIALAVADERPDARVIATDVSPAALRWAAKNVAAQGLEVELVCGDLLGPLDPALAGRVDVVVSNPPYVAEDERGSLPADVVRHEPEIALFGGIRGLAVIERLVQEASGCLAENGWLVIEIAEGRGDAVRALLQGAGYRDVATAPDLTGRERIVEARNPPS